jgi:hypothetical protein
MKLADYLYYSGLSPSDVQGQLGIKHRSTIYRYLTGECRPRGKTMQRIESLTHGKVTPKDFDDPRPPDCAVVIRRSNGRLSAVLPWSTRDGRLDAAHKASKSEPTEERILTEQARRALWILMPRAKHLGNDRFMLDGRSSDLRRIIIAANAFLISRGMDPIEYPMAHPNWRQRARSLRHRWGLTGFTGRNCS